MNRLLGIVLALFVAKQAQSQDYWLIWTHHDSRVERIHGLSLGFGTFLNKRCDVNGIKFDAPGLGVFVPIGLGSKPYYFENDSITLANLKSFDHKDQELYTTNGLYLSLSGDLEEKVNGISIHPIAGRNKVSNGLSISGLYAMNDVYRGLMLSCLFSSSAISEGLSIAGLYNYCIKLRGVQIGLFNKALDSKGVQFGLWNVNERRQSPFINWNF